ncbi:MAG: LCP family protein [Candidatus Saganbacteria bacterium]|nr:LCP family protein [Candidatus Saganbacteria bacterium]
MKKRKHKIDLLRIIVIFFIIAWILFFYINLLTPSRLPPMLRFGILDKPLNVLILGTDLYFDAETRKTKPGRTDSMLLLRYSPKKQKFIFVSIPRDSYVNISGHGMNKINSAFVMGGIPLVKNTLEDLTGKEIDRYIILNTTLLIKIVDLLGGVDLYVDKDMKYSDRAQNLHIDLKKGSQKLNGKQVNQFIRYRLDPMGDITRVKRQQQFLKALLKKMARPVQIIKAPLILNLLKENIQTDLSIKEIILLLNSARMMGKDDIQSFMLPGNTKDEEPGNWFINREEIDKLFLKHF